MGLRMDRTSLSGGVTREKSETVFGDIFEKDASGRDRTFVVNGRQNHRIRFHDNGIGMSLVKPFGKGLEWIIG